MLNSVFIHETLKRVCACVCHEGNVYLQALLEAGGLVLGVFGNGCV